MIDSQHRELKRQSKDLIKEKDKDKDSNNQVEFDIMFAFYVNTLKKANISMIHDQRF